MSDSTFIFIAAFGSLVQEVIYLYDIRNALSLPDNTSILKSWKYWLITLAMIIISGVGTWLLYGDSLNIKSVVFILGAAFPLLFKKLVARVVNQPTIKEALVRKEFSLKNYFI